MNQEGSVSQTLSLLEQYFMNSMEGPTPVSADTPAAFPDQGFPASSENLPSESNQNLARGDIQVFVEVQPHWIHGREQSVTQHDARTLPILKEKSLHAAIKIPSYNGPAKIVVSCVTAEEPYRPHPFCLCGDECGEDGVLTRVMSIANNMVISFGNFSIKFVNKEELADIMCKREQSGCDPFQTGFDQVSFTSLQDLCSVRLCFQVFLESSPQHWWTVVLPPVVSDPIRSIFLDVKIKEQPLPFMRFRYGSERPSPVLGEGKNPIAIQIPGYEGQAKVVVSCVTRDKPYRSHPHCLRGEGCTADGVLTKIIAVTKDMTVSFPKLLLHRTKLNNVPVIKQERERSGTDPLGNGFDHFTRMTTKDLLQLRLCFQVFLETSDLGGWALSLDPVVTEPIREKGSNLKIHRISHSSASVAGGDEVMIFCDKIDIGSIEVIFFGIDDDWEGNALFDQFSIHKNVGMVFKTPRYHSLEVTETVNVFIQLRQGTACGEPYPFQLKPLESINLERKRRKLDKSPFNNDTSMGIGIPGVGLQSVLADNSVPPPSVSQISNPSNWNNALRFDPQPSTSQHSDGLQGQWFVHSGFSNSPDVQQFPNFIGQTTSSEEFLQQYPTGGTAFDNSTISVHAENFQPLDQLLDSFGCVDFNFAA